MAITSNLQEFSSAKKDYFLKKMNRNLKASLDILLVNAKSAYSVSRKSRSLNLKNHEVSLRAWRALQRNGFSRSMQDKTKKSLSG